MVRVWDPPHRLKSAVYKQVADGFCDLSVHPRTPTLASPLSSFASRLRLKCLACIQAQRKKYDTKFWAALPELAQRSRFVLELGGSSAIFVVEAIPFLVSFSPALRGSI